MQIDTPNAVVAPEALNRGHECQDPGARWILAAAGLVVLLLVSCLFIIDAMMSSLTETKPLSQSAKDQGVITAPSLELLQRFAAPNLQTNPRQDLEILRAREDQELSTYGWIDRQAGIVRLPIDRAMDLLTQRGLPVRSTNVPTPEGKSSLDLILERSQTR